MRTCKCHGAPMISNGQHLICAVKRSAKMKRYRRTYRVTDKGQANDERVRAKRLRVGDTYCGYAKTVEQAELIKAHIRGRLATFTGQSERTAD